MSLMDVIDSLQSDAAVPITRRAEGSYGTSGIWTPGAITSMFTIIASIQPATGMQRVVGGRDMRSDETGEYVDDVRVVYSNVELRARVTGVCDPDTLTYEGGTWVVTRTEKWPLNDEIIYRSLITRQSKGAA